MCWTLFVNVVLRIRVQIEATVRGAVPRRAAWHLKMDWGTTPDPKQYPNLSP